MNMRSLFSLLAMLLFVSACEFGAPIGGGGTGGEGLTGVIVDPNGAPVAGAKVRVFPGEEALAKAAAIAEARRDSTVTGLDGGFRFLNLPKGRYNLEASIQNGDTTFALFIPGINLVKSIDLGTDTLRASGSLRLEVRDAQSSWLPGAACVIAGSSWSTVSDSAGMCVFPAIAPGVYQVRVTAAGISVLAPAVGVAPGAHVDGGNVSLIGEGWILTSQQGYTFHVPPDLEFTGVGGLLDSWSAGYSSQTLTLSLVWGMVGPLERPDSFPEYSEATLLRDSGELLVLSYRVPDQIAGIPRYQAGARWTGTVAKAIVISPIFYAFAETPQDLERGIRILKSIRRWNGPGPAPLSPPGKPILEAPLDGAILASASPSLYWYSTAYADSFEVEVASDSAFAVRVYSNRGIPAPPMPDPQSPPVVQVPIGEALAAGATYYWRVRGRNAERTGAWSETRRFTTIDSGNDTAVWATHRLATFEFQLPPDMVALDTNITVEIWTQHYVSDSLTVTATGVLQNRSLPREAPEYAERFLPLDSGTALLMTYRAGISVAAEYVALLYLYSVDSTQIYSRNPIIELIATTPTRSLQDLAVKIYESVSRVYQGD